MMSIQDLQTRDDTRSALGSIIGTHRKDPGAVIAPIHNYLLQVEIATASTTVTVEDGKVKVMGTLLGNFIFDIAGNREPDFVLLAKDRSTHGNTAPDLTGDYDDVVSAGYDRYLEDS